MLSPTNQQLRSIVLKFDLFIVGLSLETYFSIVGSSFQEESTLFDNSFPTHEMLHTVELKNASLPIDNM